MNIHALDLNLLGVLHALLEERSVSRAARRMGITQPAASNALARLRAQLDDPVLVRVGREMALSPRAEPLVEPVRALVEGIERVMSPPARVEPASLRRTFRVATSDHVDLVLLPELEAILSTEAPGVDLHAQPVPRDVTAALREGRADLAIGGFDDVPSDLCAARLFEDRFVCLLRRGHPLGAAELTLERYVALTHILVAPRGEPRGLVDRALRARGLSRRVARTVAHFLAAPFIAARSDHVLTLPERLALPMARLLDLDVRPPPLPLAAISIVALWHLRFDADLEHGFLRGAVARAAARVASA
jgi:DNA-binding transcriptional LysR family regulator